MEVQKAVLTKNGGILTIDGIDILLGEKKTLLNRPGIAIIIPVDNDAKLIDGLGSMAMDVDGGGLPQYMEDGTTNAIVVVLGRRAWDAVNTGEGFGQSIVPTMDEALKELESGKGWEAPEWLDEDII